MSGQVTLFENEDEAELIDRYVELMAKHKYRYSAFEICQYIFMNLRDPALRAGQAAQVWSSDLSIRERIDDAIIRGSGNSGIDTKEAKLKVLKQIYEDINIPAKDRIAAITAAASMQGEIVKAIDKTIKDERKPEPPVFIFKTYEDE